MKPQTSRPAGPNPGPGYRVPPVPYGRISRRERELLRHKAELIEATEHLLMRKSLHELTVQDIAAESEFSVGYIYKLYESKADIITALIKEKLRALRAVIEDSADGTAGWEDSALNLIEALSDWMQCTPVCTSRVTPHLKDFTRNHPAVEAEFTSFLEYYRDFTERLFAHAVSSGRICEREPGEAARSFRALIAGYSEEALLYSPGVPGTLAREAPLIVSIIKTAFAPRGGDA